MRVRGLRFIPTSTNFSRLPEGAEENLVMECGEEDIFGSDLDKELILLQSISKLSTDKERCVMLFEIIRELGYAVDYTSIATALGIRLRWLMRIKAGMHQKVEEITTNT